MKTSKWLLMGFVSLASLPALAQEREGRGLPAMTAPPIQIESGGVSIVADFEGNTRTFASRARYGKFHNEAELVRYLKESRSCFAQGLKFASDQVTNIAWNPNITEFAKPSRKAKLSKLKVTYTGNTYEGGGEGLSFDVAAEWEVPLPGVDPELAQEFCNDLKQVFPARCLVARAAESKVTVVVGYSRTVVGGTEAEMLRSHPGRACASELKYSGLNLGNAIHADGQVLELQVEKVTSALIARERARVAAEAAEKARIEAEKNGKEEADKKVDQLIEEIGTRDAKASSEAAI